MIYDTVAFGVFLLFIIFDTGRTLYKWCYWKRTGKLPVKKSEYANRKGKQLLDEQKKTDTSALGLLTDKN